MKAEKDLKTKSIEQKNKEVFNFNDPNNKYTWGDYIESQKKKNRLKFNYTNSNNTTTAPKKESLNKIRMRIISFILIFIVFSILFTSISNINTVLKLYDNEKVFRILSAPSNKEFDESLIKWSKKAKVKIAITYDSDINIVHTLNDNKGHMYDAVWMSNSIWLYNLNNSYQVINSKSIGINPVVFGVKKSVAKELGFIDKDVYNRDILKAIKDKKLKYVMTSVTNTNSGATAYLGFLNSLSGNPEVLTLDMLNNAALEKDLIDLFSGVERISGDEEYIDSIFIKGNYNAIINSESTLISLNKELISKNKEPLYLIYPVDGVAINDMPFAYIERNQNKTEKFDKIQQYLLSKEAKEILESQGKRTWYGGVKETANNNTFKKEWGIDTSKYLTPLKYPSKAVISSAIDLYVESLRKPTHTIFCVDVSGSMYGNGITELQEALNYILDHNLASKDNIQFSKKDQISIIPFSSDPQNILYTNNGQDTKSMLNEVKNLYPQGGTNIYTPLIRSLEMLNNTSDDYMKVIILMTDGKSNSNNYDRLYTHYQNLNNKIPIYAITFGNSDESELIDIVNLTNGKLFDGKTGLKRAFSEVRSYG